MRRIALIAALAACSYTKPADVPGDGSGTPIDAARRDALLDAPACTAAMSYGTVAPANQTGQNFVVNSTHIEIWQGGLDTKNIANVQLTSGLGPFNGTDITTGTFTLGSETNLTVCGACVAIATRNANDTGFSDYYIALMGTLQIDMVAAQGAAGTIAGTLTNAMFVKLVTDANGDPTTTQIPSCTSSIASMSFTADAPPS